MGLKLLLNLNKMILMQFSNYRMNTQIQIEIDWVEIEPMLITEDRKKLEIVH